MGFKECYRNVYATPRNPIVRYCLACQTLELTLFGVRVEDPLHLHSCVEINPNHIFISRIAAFFAHKSTRRRGALF